MADPVFLTLNQVLALHEEAIRVFGPDHECLSGCTVSLLDSAVHAPLNIYLYERPGRTAKGLYAALAAAYWFHISCNHPFVDGNKRTSFLAADVFLRQNGYRLAVPFGVGLRLSIAIASGQLSRRDLANRMRRYVAEQPES